MQIKAHILANRAQEVPIPIPGTEITTGLTKSMGNVSVHFVENYCNSGNFQPMPSVEPTDKTINVATPSYVHYYDRTGITGNPLPVDFETHWDGWCDTRPSPAMGYECFIQNVSGRIVFGGLTPGKYVAVIEHYYGDRGTGYWSSTPPKPSSFCQVNGIFTPKYVRGTTDGVCYGETTGASEEYRCDIGYALGNGRVVKFIQKQSFVVGENETGKTITFGGDNFSLSQFCTLVGADLSSEGDVRPFGAFFSGTVAWRTRVYTEA